jgi:predicted  nucleic acid-binding Zn-ribbon protein
MAKRKTQEWFLSRATERHSGKYTYENAVYTVSSEKVVVTCPEHGDFQITAADHLYGKGCAKCWHLRKGLMKRNTQTSFLEKAEAKYGNAYDYSETLFIGNGEHLSVVCPVHGPFSIVAKEHLRGCGRCGYDRANKSKCLTKEEFVDRAVKVHGNKYDYSHVEYVHSGTRVRILCDEHGLFEQTPSNHLSGTTCPSCAKYGFDQNKPAILYVLDADGVTKVGITNRTAEERLMQIRKSCTHPFAILKTYTNPSGQILSDVETLILRELRQQYQQPLEKFDGYKETFYNVNLASLLNRIEELIAVHAADNKEQYSSYPAAQAA